MRTNPYKAPRGTQNLVQSPRPLRSALRRAVFGGLIALTVAAIGFVLLGVFLWYRLGESAL